jgi:hypothetical protein
MQGWAALLIGAFFMAQQSLTGTQYVRAAQDEQIVKMGSVPSDSLIVDRSVGTMPCRMDAQRERLSFKQDSYHVVILLLW